MSCQPSPPHHVSRVQLSHVTVRGHASEPGSKHTVTVWKMLLQLRLRLCNGVLVSGEPASEPH